MSYERQSKARDEFTAKVAKLLRLDDDSASQLAELIEDFITGTVMEKHEDEYYHNSKQRW